MKKNPLANRPMPSLDLDDPLLIATAEKALAPYRKILSPKMLEAFRREVIEQLAVNPEAVALARKLKRSRVVAQSDEVWLSPRAEEKPASSGDGGRGGSSGHE
ncbi:MAG: hypothetical protein L6Q76_31125, partial [Polyangiaceae bacterium]|nr:hypothetical protein [Polyangiaceae bacterium]